jgi:hypothetical protein
MKSFLLLIVFAYAIVLDAQTYVPSMSSGSATAPALSHPTDVATVLSGFSSVGASTAVLYITASGTTSAGTLYLSYSINSGTTFTNIQEWTASFSSTSITVPITGLSNLNTVQLRLEAVTPAETSSQIAVSNWYATLSGGYATRPYERSWLDDEIWQLHNNILKVMT